jgi:APA family basic amino acid/polyamine antiporter|tara:strand:- start:486 stop:1856 length:1371 start_codon:yes stop_codon:yes gene_type:complete
MPTEPTATFAKTLARREVLTLSFGAMIGWSWVLLTGEWLMRAGSLGTTIAFVIGGIAVILISLTYAELAAAMPKAGGEHVYTHRALGYGASFVASWAIVLAYINVCVFESAALPTALAYVFPDLAQGYLWTIAGADVHITMIAVGVIAAIIMTGINFVGIRFAAFVQTLMTFLIMLVGLSFISGAALFEFSGTSAPLFTKGAVGILGVLVMVPALMVGFDVIPQSAEEIDLPPALIGKLLVFSVSLAAAWYIAISLAVGSSLNTDEIANSGAATADAMANVWDSQMMGNLMILAGVGGILTSWNAFIIGGSRVLYALAETGMIPKVFARVHPKYKTPYVAILFIGLLSCISPFFGRTILVWLVDAGSFMVVIAYGMVAFAFLKLRYSEPEMPRPFRVAQGKFVGVLALILSVGLGCLYLPGSPAALIWPYEWLMVLGGAVLGAAFYFNSLRRGSTP